MLFSKKKKTASTRYILYINRVMKYKQLLVQLSIPNAPSDLIYFFDQTRDEMAQLLQAKGLTKIRLIRAQNLSSTSQQRAMIIEVHPLKSVSDKLVAQFQPEAEIQFWVGIDESILKMFGQEKMISLMERMGMKEDEAIEHSMVGKSIERAQEKLESDISHPKDIRSSLDDWEAANRTIER